MWAFWEFDLLNVRSTSRSARKEHPTVYHSIT